MEEVIHMKNAVRKKRYGSLAGLSMMIVISFGLYFVLGALQPGTSTMMDYGWVVNNIDRFPQQMVWFFMNFTEPNFIGGFLSSIMMLLGAAAAWLGAIKGTKWMGFEICYGNARIWPWVFASQVVSLLLTMYAFNYLSLFGDGVTWIPTFIVTVNVPPALVLIYGPGWKTLLTTSVLGAALCTPTAFWLNHSVFANWNVPGVVGNVSAMAIVGLVASSACDRLPWMEKTATGSIDKKPAPDDVRSASWLVRRAFADLTEPLFYGSDLAGMIFVVGVVVEWMLSPGLIAGGNLLVPGVMCAALLSGAIGIFLYADKWEEKGWYATYVPVVSAAPACVYLFGGSIPVILFASVVGGVIGAPLAEHIGSKMPGYVPGTVANVTSMAVCTALIATAMNLIPWF